MGQPAIALYDQQCEICQAMVSWIQLLDPSGEIACVAIDPDRLTDHHPDLDLDACLQRLHVIADGEVSDGWQAVVAIARRLPRARPLVWIDRFDPTRRIARSAYDWLAANRYELSKCRGGACSIDKPATTKRLAPLQVFWTCYNLGLVFRLPLIASHVLRTQADHVVNHARTYRKAVPLLDGKLKLLFLGGIPTDAVPLAFGERFAAIVYNGVLIDPGSVKMRRSMTAHADAGAVGEIEAVTVTHHHEEHSGNLAWAADLVDAPLFVGEVTATMLRPPAALPRSRRTFIGQPPPLTADARPLGGRLETSTVSLEVIPATGHCDDHVVFWDPDERVLLVGDAFMGVHFSSPNPDVDSTAWIETLERLISLGPEIMVEGHGHVHTLRADVPDVAGVVNRRDPVELLNDKLEVLRWVREQVASGLDEGLKFRAIEATCFPWGMSWSWENVVADETARLLTAGEFSRSELVRSFHRHDDNTTLPEVLTLRTITAPD